LGLVFCRWERPDPSKLGIWDGPGAYSHRLEGLPEIERENILAGRLEEMQKLKDSMQLDAMYKMAGMGGDEEEEDDEPSRKKRECECRVSGTY
jgi:hypothetical protein